VKRISIPFVVLMMTITISAFAAEKMQIAVLDLHPKGVSKIVSGAVSDIIRSEMVKTGLFAVVERSQMDEIMKEQGFQMTGCTDQSCAVKVGKLLSAKKILIGEINKIGKAFMITVRIVDVEKGLSEFAANEKAETEDVLDKAGMNITRKLSENIVEGNKEFFVVRKTRSGYYLRSIVPGWGQIYAEHEIKGSVFAGVFLASVGYSVYSYMDYNKKNKDYKDLPAGTSLSVFDSKADKAKKAENMKYISFGICGAVYLTHWVDVIFFSKPAFEEKSAYSGNVRFDIAVNRFYVSPVVPERRIDAVVTCVF
jgi:hypothetical protein